MNILRSNVAGDFQSLSYVAKPKPIPEHEQPKTEPLVINYGLTEATEKVLPGGEQPVTAEAPVEGNNIGNDVAAVAEPSGQNGSDAGTGTAGTNINVQSGGLQDQQDLATEAITDAAKNDSPGRNVVSGIFFPIKQIATLLFARVSPTS